MIPASSGDPTAQESVVVTGTFVSTVTIYDFGPFTVPTAPNIQPPTITIGPGGQSKVPNEGTGQCDSKLLSWANMLRKNAHRLNQWSTAGIALAGYAALAGGPEAPFTFGGSEIPAGGIAAVSLAGYKIAGWMDIIGAKLQSQASGNQNPGNEAALAWHTADSAGRVAGRLAPVVDVGLGAIDAASGSPEDMTCPVG